MKLRWRKPKTGTWALELRNASHWSVVGHLWWHQSVMAGAKPGHGTWYWVLLGGGSNSSRPGPARRPPFLLVTRAFLTHLRRQQDLHRRRADACEELLFRMEQKGWKP